MNEREIQKFKKNHQKYIASNITKMFTADNAPNIYRQKYSTGFSKLDEELGGGFSVGLHYIKTTPGSNNFKIILQIIENFIKSDTDCVFFSLEKNADYVIDLINEKHKEYKNILDKWCIIDSSIGLITADNICEFANNYKEVYQKTPVIIIDSFHFLVPSEYLKGKSTQDIMNDNLLALKKISANFPVILVSSFDYDNQKHICNTYIDNIEKKCY